ncbi:hypothetical protein JCM3263A_02140 [Thermobifida fusca]
MSKRHGEQAGVRRFWGEGDIKSAAKRAAARQSHYGTRNGCRGKPEGTLVPLGSKR